MKKERRPARLGWSVAPVCTVLLVLPILSCVEPRQATEPVTLWITVALFGPLGDGGEETPIPEDLSKLLLPFDAQECPGVVFFPEVALERVDGQPLGRLIEGRGGAKDQLTELTERNYEGFLGSIRQGFGQKPDVGTLERVMASELANATLGPRFANLEASSSQWSVPDLERRYSDAACLFVLSDEDAAGGRSRSSRSSTKIFHNAGPLTEELAERACAALKSGNAEGLAFPCPILYRPRFSPGVVETRTGGNRTHNGDHPTDPPLPPTPSADATYEALARRLEHADPGERQKLLENLIQAELSFSTDYRFTYEKVKLAVYGVASHPEAFHWLAVAAEKAIQNGQGGRMLTQLRRDAESDESISRLARGHAESWDPIIDALSTRNVGGLRPILSGAASHHH